MKKRNSNFDLMKIISMLMIVMWHFLIHGKVLDNTTGNLHTFLLFIMSILSVHVNSFVLVTGYFQYEKKIRLSKLFSLNNIMWFYKIIIFLIFIIFGLRKFTNYEIFKNLMPFNYSDYWFIMIYLFLYLCSPLLNIIIKNVNQQQYKIILFTIFIITSILSTISNQEIFNNGNGYSLTNFIFLYLIGAYISKYGIKRLEKSNIKNIAYLIILIILNTLTINYFLNLNTNNFYLIRLKTSVINSQYGYARPLVIIQSVIYFYIFKKINIKSKLLTIISSTTLGIYMMHDNIYIREYMYLNIFKLPITTLYSKTIFFKMIIYVLIVTIICCILELLRKYIFKKIYNLKQHKILRNKITNIIQKYEIEW